MLVKDLVKNLNIQKIKKNEITVARFIDPPLLLLLSLCDIYRSPNIPNITQSNQNQLLNRSKQISLYGENPR